MTVTRKRARRPVNEVGENSTTWGEAEQELATDHCAVSAAGACAEVLADDCRNAELLGKRWLDALKAEQAYIRRRFGRQDDWLGANLTQFKELFTLP